MKKVIALWLALLVIASMAIVSFASASESHRSTSLSETPRGSPAFVGHSITNFQAINTTTDRDSASNRPEVLLITTIKKGERIRAPDVMITSIRFNLNDMIVTTVTGDAWRTRATGPHL